MTRSENPRRKITLQDLKEAEKLFRDTKFPDFMESREVYTTHLKILNQHFEQVIKEVLRKYLDREPTLEDAKRCELSTLSNFPQKQVFKFDGTILGTIEFEYPKMKDPLSLSVYAGVNFLPVKYPVPKFDKGGITS